MLVFAGIKVEVTGPVDCFSGLRRRQHRQPSEPTPLQHHHGVDVTTANKSPVSVDSVGLELTGGVFGQLRHWTIDRADVETVVQHSQRRAVTGLPTFTKPDQSDPKFHCYRFMAFASISNDNCDKFSTRGVIERLRKVFIFVHRNGWVQQFDAQVWHAPSLPSPTV